MRCGSTRPTGTAISPRSSTSPGWPGTRPGASTSSSRRTPSTPNGIQVYERWESDEDLLAFRSSGGPDLDLPPLVSADVRKYRIAGVEAP
ncbi:hypothetical protein GCM10020218_060980 [Dactylosporangium vinaceum]